MRLRSKTIKIAAVLTVSFFAALIVFIVRPPVLIISDLSFAGLYGKNRLRSETAYSSFVLFRRLKYVAVADDAGDDIVLTAVEKASLGPFCVIFPLRFAKVARSFREKNPAVPVVILEGRSNTEDNPVDFAIGGNTEDYFIYKTDISADFYRAGLAAAIIDGDKSERIAVFLEPNINIQAKDAFLKAQNDINKPQQTSFFTVFSQFSGNQGISCVVLGGIGAEYLDKYSGIPVIFFTWINPELIPLDVVLVFNDSPPIQIVPAVRMVQSGMTKGKIQSKILFTGGKGVDKVTVRKLRKI